MNELITKMDYGILHYMPFKPTKNRTRGFDVIRTFGDTTYHLSADWSLNAYDLITFTQILKQYQADKASWVKSGEMGKGEYKRQVIEMEIDIEKIVKERKLHNKKIVRKGILESYKRLFSIKLEVMKKGNGGYFTSYFYDVEYDEDIKKMTAYVNEDFIKHCIKNGMLFNYSRLIEYKKNYSILLDAYMQSTKTKTKKTDKKSKNGKDIYEYEYKRKYKLDELLEKLYLNEVKKSIYNKVDILKQAFKELEIRGNFPLYEYDKREKCFTRQDILKGLLC